MLSNQTYASGTTQGRVLIAPNGNSMGMGVLTFGTVCDAGWDDADATVVCRALRFGVSGVALPGGSSGTGAAQQPIYAGGLACLGDEEHPGLCGGTWFGDVMDPGSSLVAAAASSCSHARDAAVVCFGFPREPGSAWVACTTGWGWGAWAPACLNRVLTLLLCCPLLPSAPRRARARPPRQRLRQRHRSAAAAAPGQRYAAAARPPARLRGGAGQQHLGRRVPAHGQRGGRSRGPLVQRRLCLRGVPAAGLRLGLGLVARLLSGRTAHGAAVPHGGAVRRL
jgi:hypothetical protein